MFYILHKRNLLPIDPDRVYAFCPRCGVLHASKVRETHGDSKYAKEYTMIADLMELHFKED